MVITVWAASDAVAGSTPVRPVSSTIHPRRKPTVRSRLGGSQPRQGGRAGAHVLGAFRVVRRRRQHRQRPGPETALVVGVEVVDGDPEPAGIATDLAQRRQPEIPVERTVLGTFRHHRPGELLPSATHLDLLGVLRVEQGASHRSARDRTDQPLGVRVIGQVRPVAGQPRREPLDLVAIDPPRWRRALGRRS